MPFQGIEFIWISQQSLIFDDLVCILEITYKVDHRAMRLANATAQSTSELLIEYSCRFRGAQKQQTFDEREVCPFI